MGKAKIKNYFPGGNTPQGFFSYYKYLPYRTEHTFIIKGGPGTGKSTFMKRIGKELIEQGYDIEYHWCSSDNNSLDGLVVPELNITIFDGTAPHMLDPVYPGAVEEIINVGAFWDSTHLQTYKKEIISLTNLIKRRFQQVYRYLKSAKQIYDDWKEYYTINLDLDQANQKTREILNSFPTNRKYQKGPVRHLFGSALTPEGPVEYLNNLTEEIKNLYFIKGEPGTGKSTLINYIAEELNKNGYYVLCLHRPFEPDKLDGIIIPEIDTAIITTSPPFNIEPGSRFKLIDMMGCLNEGNSKYHGEIASTVSIFDKLVFQANQYLKLAKKAHDELEEYYIRAMDFDGLEEMRRDFMKKILP
jgi:hypothetical protein